ncbi:hypothetical protein AFK24_23720 [Pseudomonas syringae]|uniref:Uncharacterized protein n=1 Tax=Pseudomonas syringae TaxID=317 RepID=A0A1C7YZA3_PSESX|nr:hypothetical protein [Pseudomonas syringae]OCR22136.1 hypothetical protein AFK24_23720 [Pseudomonas syringae]
MAELYTHLVAYRFNGEQREQSFELTAAALPAHVAALHLLQLHFGDSENSLIMPSADSAPDEIVRQALLLGISDIHTEPAAPL